MHVSPYVLAQATKPGSALTHHASRERLLQAADLVVMTDSFLFDGQVPQPMLPMDILVPESRIVGMERTRSMLSLGSVFAGGAPNPEPIMTEEAEESFGDRMQSKAAGPQRMLMEYVERMNA